MATGEPQKPQQSQVENIALTGWLFLSNRGHASLHYTHPDFSGSSFGASARFRFRIRDEKTGGKEVKQ